ncbi:hypothetical protein TYRP_011810 [Tyrophagus putrescentiae]|nr:hypothetical protein TYRP_011810 [Tyrophagus putrescentiae]
MLFSDSQTTFDSVRKPWSVASWYSLPSDHRIVPAVSDRRRDAGRRRRRRLLAALVGDNAIHQLVVAQGADHAHHLRLRRVDQPAVVEWNAQQVKDDALAVPVSYRGHIVEEKVAEVLHQLRRRDDLNHGRKFDVLPQEEDVDDGEQGTGPVGVLRHHRQLQGAFPPDPLQVVLLVQVHQGERGGGGGGGAYRAAISSRSSSPRSGGGSGLGCMAQLLRHGQGRRQRN